MRQRDITGGRWVFARDAQEHENFKRYGQATVGDWSARVQKGTYAGPGNYLLLGYSQRCPRNCCYDDVYEMVPAAEVLEELKGEMSRLARLFKEARHNCTKGLDA